MSDITIPPEAVEAALPFAASCAYYCKPSANDCQCRQNTYRALRAGIAAWPGMHCYTQPCFTWNGTGAAIVLPLPKENTNAEG